VPGRSVFTRMPRNLRLSAAGENLIAHVRDALRTHERAVARAAAHSERMRGEVTVATVTGLASCMLGAFGARQL
jgi:DNA-binding transcriptional LysR family regulator